jgi:hypothetical protein
MEAERPDQREGIPVWGDGVVSWVLSGGEGWGVAGWTDRRGGRICRGLRGWGCGSGGLACGWVVGVCQPWCWVY